MPGENPYASIAQELPAEQPAPANPYGEVARDLPLDQEEEAQSRARRAAWAAATDRRNPDQQAAALRISHDTGAEPDYVLRNLDEAGRRHQASRTDWNELARNNPELSKTAVDPVRGPLVRDDLKNLNALEWAVSGAPTVDGYQAPVWVEAARKGWAAMRLQFESTREQLGLDPAWTQVLYPFSTTPTKPELRERKVLDLETASRELHAKNIITHGFTKGFEMAPLIAGNVAAGAVAGPAGVVAFNAGTFYGQTREQLTALRGPNGEQLSDAQATALAAASSIGGGLAMAFGLGPVARSFSAPILERIAGNAVQRALVDETLTRQVVRAVATWGAHNAAGAASMAAATALEDLALQSGELTVGIRSELDVGRLTDRTVEAFKAAFRDFMVMSAFGPGRRFLHDRGISDLSTTEATRLSAIAEGAKNSKLGERAPEELGAFVDRVAPGQQVLADLPMWNRYWQEKKVDPRAMAVEIAGDGGKAYDAAAAANADLSLPLGKYVEKLGKTPHIVGLQADTKLSPEARTPRQELEHQKQLTKLDEEAKKARGASFEQEKDQIRKTIADQIARAGRPKDEAAAIAEMVAEYSGAMALRMNVSVAEAAALGGLHRLRFVGPQGEQLVHDAQEALRAQLSPALRANLDAARAGDRRAQARLEAAAYVKPLTGLLNDVAFEDYRANRPASGWDVAIDANDLGAQDVKGGHEVGNAYLRTIADAMRKANETTGNAGRLFHWGGDEFHAGGFSSPEAAIAYAQALKEHLGATPEVAPGWRASVSMGVGQGVGAADRATLEAKAAKKLKRGSFKEDRAKADIGAGESFFAFSRESAPDRVATIEGAPVTAKLNQGGPEGPRGTIEMRIDPSGRPVEFRVEALAGDRSTLAHETAHFLSWSLADIANSDRATPEIRADYEALLKYAGFASHEERLASSRQRAESGTTAEELKALSAKEEKISHAWEAYLLEGRAPSSALARTFARFKAWMTRIYRGLPGIQEQYRQNYGQELQLSDEVRGIFDRLLSAETETSRAEAEIEGAAAEDMLAAMTPEDRADMEAAREGRRAASERELLRLTAEANAAERDTLRERMRSEEDAKAAQEPVYRVLEYFKREKAPEAGIVDAALGQVDPTLLDAHGQPHKLSRSELVAVYGEDFVKTLPRGTTAKEGVSADFLAERFGFASGDELVRALQGAPKREALVEARVNERMRAEYPSLLENPAQLAEAAMDAAHSPAAMEEALVGARILARRVDPGLSVRFKALDPKAAKERAEALMAESHLSEISPAKALAAERRAAREAMDLTAKALRTKDAEKAREIAHQAMDARERQVLNQALYRAARDGQAEAQGHQEHLLGFTSDAAQRRLGKATSTETTPDGQTVVTQPYLAAMNDVLATVELRPSVSAAEVRRREAFNKFLSSLPTDQQQDLLTRIRPSLLENLDKTRRWSDLTLQELRDLREAADGIAHQAQLKSKLRRGREERDREEAILGLVDELRARFPGGQVTRLHRGGAGEAAGRGKRTVFSSLTRIEELTREMGGEATKLIWDPLSDGDVDFRRLVREVSAPIMEEIDRLPREDRKLLQRRFVVDGHELDGEAAVALLANWGNDSNRQKTLRGEAALAERFQRVQPMSAETVQKVFKQMTRAQAELVNRIWERLDAKWEPIAALEAKFTGKVPPKIEPKPFDLEVSDGVVKMRGGYYPMIYDPTFSSAGARRMEAEAGVGALAFAPNYERAATPQGHLQERIEDFARPVQLSLTGLPRHITGTMKDLAMRESLVQVRDVLTDGRVRDAITDGLGAEYYEKLLEHWRDSANELALPKGHADFMVRWANARRSAVAGAVFAGNVGQALQNFSNVLPALEAVPVRFAARGALRFASERLGLVDQIKGLSPYMNERFEGGQDHTIGRALADVTGKQGAVARFSEDVRRVGMWMMETTDTVTAAPVWWGAYEHAQEAKARGGLEFSAEEAVKHADQVVRLSMGSSRTIDKSGFERDPLWKHLTMFYGYMNSQLNRFIAAHADASLLWNDGFRGAALRRIAKSYALLMATGVAADVLVGKGPPPNDDDEIGGKEWAQWMATRATLYPFATLPIVGQFLQNVTGGAKRDLSLTAWTRAATPAAMAIYYGVKAGSEDAAGDEAYKAGISALEAFGWYYGLPVAQFRQTGDYWLDITPDGLEVSPEAQDDSAAARVFKTLYGKNRHERLGEALFGPGGTP